MRCFYCMHGLPVPEQTTQRHPLSQPEAAELLPAGSSGGYRTMVWLTLVAVIVLAPLLAGPGLMICAISAFAWRLRRRWGLLLGCAYFTACWFIFVPALLFTTDASGAPVALDPQLGPSILALGLVVLMIRTIAAPGIASALELRERGRQIAAGIFLGVYLGATIFSILVGVLLLVRAFVG